MPILAGETMGGTKIESIRSEGVKPITPQAQSIGGASQPTVSQPSTTPAQPTDGVESQRPDVSGGITPAERRAADEQNSRALERQSYVEQTIQQADDAKKRGFWGKVLEFFTTFGRAIPILGQLLSVIAAAFRVLKVIFMVLFGQADQLDFKKELRGLAVDVIGISVPLAGALGSAAKNIWFNESEILGGMNMLFDGDQEKESAIRDTVDWVKDKLNSVFQAGKHLITGGDSVKPTENQVPFRPLAPAEVPIG